MSTLGTRLNREQKDAMLDQMRRDLRGKIMGSKNLSTLEKEIDDVIRQSRKYATGKRARYFREDITHSLRDRIQADIGLCNPWVPREGRDPLKLADIANRIDNSIGGWAGAKLAQDISMRIIEDVRALPNFEHKAQSVSYFGTLMHKIGATSSFYRGLNREAFLEKMVKKISGLSNAEEAINLTAHTIKAFQVIGVPERQATNLKIHFLASIARDETPAKPLADPAIVEFNGQRFEL